MKVRRKYSLDNCPLRWGAGSRRPGEGSIERRSQLPRTFNGKALGTRLSSLVFALAIVAVRLSAAPNERLKLSFVKDIVPIFTKSGCANSNCHGSIRGQAGFKLSLFGYEPSLDYDAIVKAQDGRRINRQDPAKSLILQKPTFSVPHGGGERFKIGSLEYEAILDWIRDGATY